MPGVKSKYVHRGLPSARTVPIGNPGRYGNAPEERVRYSGEYLAFVSPDAKKRVIPEFRYFLDLHPDDALWATRATRFLFELQRVAEYGELENATHQELVDLCESHKVPRSRKGRKKPYSGSRHDSTLLFFLSLEQRENCQAKDNPPTRIGENQPDPILRFYEITDFVLDQFTKRS